MFKTAVAMALALPLWSATPAPGGKAPDFQLPSLRGGTVRFSDLHAKGTVVLIVLRGFPGYQCPACDRQVRDMAAHARELSDAGARVVFIYPGPSKDLEARAREFTANKSLPDAMDFLLDPDYEFTNLYNLRWDAPKETAYPSTFIVDQAGTVIFSRISRSHGGRTSASEILEELRRRR